MSLETEKPFNNQLEAPPSYNDTLENNTDICSQFQGSSNMADNELITYTVSKRGCFKKMFDFKNNQTGETYNFKVSYNTSKFLDLLSGQEILKLKRQGFSFTTTRWNVDYLVKNSERYQEVSMVKKTFEFRDKYVLNLKKQDNTMANLHWTTTSILGNNWTLFDSQNQPLLEYHINMFKKNTLKQFKYIDEVDLPIYLIFLVTLTMDAERRRRAASSGGGS
ncbi:hypothetical protein K502DRAFT_350148 [Neoconidiobolus thromboides FSU 785]|nr:hypothetical protein K502DRAFT_350148 [Neoconidiobolus thromboides FSU 785]